MGFLSPSSPHWGDSRGEGSQSGGPEIHLLTHPPTYLLRWAGILLTRHLPVAAGRPRGALGLGTPRAEGPTIPRIEAVAARRIASCPHGCGQ